MPCFFRRLRMSSARLRREFVGLFESLAIRLLGEGTYGKVYAIKWLEECYRKELLWNEEVAAYSAVPQHDHIVHLLDVLCVQGQLRLVFPLYETNLADVLQKLKGPSLRRAEYQCIGQALLQSIAT